MKYREIWNVLDAALAVFLLVFGLSCHQLMTAPAAPQQPVTAAAPPPPQAPVMATPPPPRLPTGAVQHDTPIIIQGGSLLVWSKQALSKDSGTKRLTTAVNAPISLIEQFKDSKLTDVIQTYTIPAQFQDSWALCARKPHLVRITPLGSSQVAIDSWDKHAGKDMFREDNADETYPYKQRHQRPDPLEGLYFGQGACKAIVQGSHGICSTVLDNAPCFVECPGKKCYIGLGY